MKKEGHELEENREGCMGGFGMKTGKREMYLKHRLKNKQKETSHFFFKVG